MLDQSTELGKVIIILLASTCLTILNIVFGNMPAFASLAGIITLGTAAYIVLYPQSVSTRQNATQGLRASFTCFGSSALFYAFVLNFTDVHFPPEGTRPEGWEWTYWHTLALVSIHVIVISFFSTVITAAVWWVIRHIENENGG